jgi:predicted nucleotidyltransferase component of viral defense system
MKRQVENVPASIQARLKNEADKRGRFFNEILQYYGMERFLYRLSKTTYANDFILKGGLMFYGLDVPMRRPTRDIDFLGTEEYTQKDLLTVFRTAMSVSFPEDGVVFAPNTLRLSQPEAEANQGGIRITFVGYLGNVRLPMQVDIGFSDELASETLDIEYPVILSDMERPQLRGYPLESIISEKFHAMIRFADLNSRWKDYYDVYLLADTFEFESRLLMNAIQATFSNRPGKLTDEIPYGLRDQFAIANQENWESFLHKSKLKNDSINDLNNVIHRIWQFMEYPLQGVTAEVQEKHWTPTNGWR